MHTDSSGKNSQKQRGFRIFYAVTLKQFLSNVNMQDHKEFGVGKALKGIVMDWSDTKRS